MFLRLYSWRPLAGARVKYRRATDSPHLCCIWSSREMDDGRATMLTFLMLLGGFLDGLADAFRVFVIGFIVIILASVALVTSALKQKETKEEQKALAREQAIPTLPAVSLFGRDPNLKLSNVASLTGVCSLDPEYVLNRFEFKDGEIIVLMKNGSFIQDWLERLEVAFRTDGKYRTAVLESKQGKRKILQLSDYEGVLRKEEWDIVFYILSLAGRVYGVSGVTPEGIQQYKQMKRAYRAAKVSRFIIGI